jgi:hypothetical protein
MTMSKPKYGAGHVTAMARLGLKELRNALNPSRESAADTEIGLYGTLTQGEIADSRGGPGKGSNQESKKEYSSIEELRTDAKDRNRDNDDRGRDDDRSHDRGGRE